MRFARFGALASFALALFPATTGAQPSGKVARVGVLQVGTTAAAQPLFEAFKDAMRDRGYVAGQQVLFERRTSENKPERLADLAAELVRLKVDVIVTSTDQGIAAVKQQTQTIPIVMANSTDPVATGFVKSLARPGGNITGRSSMSSELSAKRLDLLRAVIPGVSRLAILWNPEIRGAVLDYKETEAAARSFRVPLQIQSVEVSRPDDLERGFQAMAAERAEAVIAPGVNPLAFANRAQIAALAHRHRLPSMFGTREFVESGGLLSYGASALDQWRNAAVYVDKILKGAKPADLPVERPTKFELVINLKTAKALGLTIPPAVLARADEVIQ